MEKIIAVVPMKLIVVTQKYENNLLVRLLYSKDNYGKKCTNKLFIISPLINLKRTA